MFLSFTLTLIVCLLFFLAAATLLTVTFGDRPRVVIGRPEREPAADVVLKSHSKLVLRTLPAAGARLAG